LEIFEMTMIIATDKKLSKAVKYDCMRLLEDLNNYLAGSSSEIEIRHMVGEGMLIGIGGIDEGEEYDPEIVKVVGEMAEIENLTNGIGAIRHMTEHIRELPGTFSAAFDVVIVEVNIFYYPNTQSADLILTEFPENGEEKEYWIKLAMDGD